MAQRADDHAQCQALDAKPRAEDQRAADDREVVDDRRHGRRGESAAGVEHARGDGPESEEDRAEQHDPGQLDGLVELGTDEAGGDVRDDDRGGDEQGDGEHDQPDEHQVDDRRHDSPGALLLGGREQARDDRDERRRERTGGDQLEDQVRDAERGKERVELGRSERAGDDDDADVAEDPRDEERAGHDEPGAGDRPGRAHGAVARRALGWASRYAAWSRPGDTWV